MNVQPAAAAGAAAAGAPPAAAIQPPQVHVSRIKISPYIPNNVRAWLGIAELSLYTIANPRDRYARLLAEIPSSVLAELIDISSEHLRLNSVADAAAAAALAAGLPAVPPFNWENAYTELKAAISDRNSPTDRAAIRDLLLKEKVGTQKPSAYLRSLQNIVAGRPVQCADIVREIFVNGLPANIQFFLVTQPDNLPTEDLAKMADKMWTVDQTPSSGSRAISAVTRSASPSASTSASLATSMTAKEQQMLDLMSNLASQVSALTSEITALKAGAAERGRSTERGEGRARSRSATPGRRPLKEPTTELCFYHVNFGMKAHKCAQTSNRGACQHANQMAATLPPPPPVAVSNVTAEAIERLSSQIANFHLQYPPPAAGNGQ
jgi:hypothetical protein